MLEVWEHYCEVVMKLVLASALLALFSIAEDEGVIYTTYNLCNGLM